MLWAKLRFLKFESAVIYAILARALGIIAGPVTVLVIAASFTPEIQGYYFTFASFLGFQTLLELGLGMAIQQIASHEWANLSFNTGGGIEGDRKAYSRLATLARFATRWYAVSGVIAITGFGAGGYFFFARIAGANAIHWELPWLTVALLTGINLFLLPAWSILEGCNQVSQVYGFRLVQGVLMRIALWAAMLFGWELWALPVERGCLLLLTLLFFTARYGRFFRELLQCPALHPMFWREEIWPLQWRFAMVWVTGYLASSLFVPILFLFQGPVIAGRAGMTWALISAIIAVSYAIIAARIPRFAILAAKKEYRALDRFFAHSLGACCIVVAAGSLLIAGLIYILNAADHPLADRFLPTLPTGIFLLAVFMQQIRNAMGGYLRAHKKEPYLAVSLSEACLAVAVLFPLGKWYGVTGMALGFLAVTGVMLIPALLIFQKCKKQWHTPEEMPGETERGTSVIK